MLFWKIVFQDFNIALGKVTVHKIVKWPLLKNGKPLERKKANCCQSMLLIVFLMTPSLLISMVMGLDFQLQKLIQSFLSNIKHKTKINNTYCSLEEFLLVFCKLLSSSHFHLVSSYAISFHLSIIWVLEVMLMMTNHITIYYNRLCKTGRWKQSSNKLFYWFENIKSK